MPKLVTLEEINIDIPSDAIRLMEPLHGRDAWGNPCFWVIFKDRAQRDEFIKRWRGSWVMFRDVYIKLNYAFDWFDVNGYGAHVATTHHFTEEPYRS